MIDRIGIKEQAKESIRANLKTSLISGAIMLVVALLCNISHEVVHYLQDGTAITIRTDTLFSSIFGLFIGETVFTVSKAKLFTNFLRNGNMDLNDFIYGFKNYWHNLFTILLSTLFSFLWALLFIIPGIVKGISYSLAPYIAADNPDISPIDTIRLSSVLTYGYKMDIFVFYLSYIGWFILSVLTLGILSIYVMPYLETAFANLYEQLKNKAIKEGRVPAEMFPENNKNYTVSDPINF